MNTPAKIDPTTTATELHDLENTIALFEKRAAELRAQLFKTLKEQGVRRVDLVTGESYVIYPRNKLVVKSELAAKRWALENPEARMKLDTSKAMEVALSSKLKWATVKKEEYLRISRAKSKHQDDS